MQLLVLLAADYANVEQHGKLNVMGIFGEIQSSNFPARHPEMYLIAKLTASPAEYGTKRKLTVRLLNEDATQEVVNFSNDIDIPQNPGQLRVEINQILRLRDLVFPQPGIYQFSLLIDNDEQGALPIVVAKPQKSEV